MESKAYSTNRFDKYERNVHVKPTQASRIEKEKQNAPIKKFKAGAISATVWENQSRNEQGQIVSFKNVTLERVYKDAKGEWQTTNGLRTNDLPKAILALNKAYEYLALDDANLEE